MTPEEKQLLHSIAQTVEENNKILHKMRRSQRWTSIMTVVYWIVIIGAAVGAFWFLQPYANSFFNTYSTAQSELNSIKSSFNSVNGK